MPRRALLALCALTLSLGCVADYSDPEYPALDEVPALADDDLLVFERELRWWSAPHAQRLRMYERADGSYLMLRQRWDGSATYAWGEGTLTPQGTMRLSDARDDFDPALSEPPAGSYECIYTDSLGASVIEDGERYEYLSLCPPEGLSELAELYGDLGELLLDCPLDDSWFDGEPPLTQDDCMAVSEAGSESESGNESETGP